MRRGSTAPRPGPALAGPGIASGSGASKDSRTKATATGFAGMGRARQRGDDDRSATEAMPSRRASSARPRSPARVVSAGSASRERKSERTSAGRSAAIIWQGWCQGSGRRKWAARREDLDDAEHRFDQSRSVKLTRRERRPPAPGQVRSAPQRNRARAPPSAPGRRGGTAETVQHDHRRASPATSATTPLTAGGGQCRISARGFRAHRSRRSRSGRGRRLEKARRIEAMPRRRACRSR